MANILQLDVTCANRSTRFELSELGLKYNELLKLARVKSCEYLLDTDGALSVELGGLSAVNVLIVRTLGGKVRVRITSADGAQQSIPVDSLLVLVGQAVPVTAIDLTREPATSTQVQVFLGES